MIGWRDYSNLQVFKTLRLKQNAELKIENATGPDSTVNLTELASIDVATPGTAEASKSLVLDSDKSLAWATSIATVGNVEPLALTTTLTGDGATGGRAKFALDTEANLGGWANALKGITDFGTAGNVSGLGSGIVAELVAGAGMSAGSYAPLEVELGMPSGALTGARMSLMSLNVYGAASGTFDDNGFLFDLNGVAGSDAAHMFDEVTEQAVNAQARLRVKVNSTTWYIPLCDTAALS